MEVLLSWLDPNDLPRSFLTLATLWYTVYTHLPASAFRCLVFCPNLPQLQLAYRLLSIVTSHLNEILPIIWFSDLLASQSNLDLVNRNFSSISSVVSYYLEQGPFIHRTDMLVTCFKERRHWKGWKKERNQRNHKCTPYEEKLRFNSKWQTDFRKQLRDTACSDSMACSHWKRPVTHSLPRKHTHSPSLQWPCYLPGCKATWFYSLSWQKLT